MIDIRISQPIGLDAQPFESPNEDLPPLVQFLIAGGTVLPFQTEGGQPPVAPSINVRWEFTKEHALEFASRIVEAAEQLPDPKPQSDILIPQDPQAIDKAAKAFDQFKGNLDK